MKIFNIKDAADFFAHVERCKGRVELVTNEGDRLNLKSTLSQYVSLAELLQTDKSVPELELLCSEAEDYAVLLNYMMNQQNGED